jgi:hypothetical protein
LDNNYELADFVAQETGKYKIRVYREKVDDILDDDGSTNRLGIAWVKDATYLPDIKSSYNSWDSKIIIRNDGARSRDVNVTLFNTAGSYAGGATYELGANAVWAYDPSHTNFTGSAIVDGGEDVIVIARSWHDSELTIYNGITRLNGSPGWEQTGNILYVPVVKNDWHDRDSSIEVVNVDGASTTVTAEFYKRADIGGGYIGSLTVNLDPNDRGTLSNSSCPEGEDGEYCTVRLRSNNTQPLAAVVREYDAADGGAPVTYNAVSRGANVGYMPVVKSNWGNQSSGLAVMNVNGSLSARVTITYYLRDINGIASVYTHDLGNIPPLSVRDSWLPTVTGGGSFLGSAYVSSDRDVVVLLAEAGNGFYKSGNAFSGGTVSSYVAELFNSTLYTKSAISVQNLHSSQPASVCAHYYNSAGDYLIGEDRCASIPPLEQYTFHHWNSGLPSDFQGSAWVESVDGQPIAVVVHEAETTSSGPDRQAAFNGSNR